MSIDILKTIEAWIATTEEDIQKGTNGYSANSILSALLKLKIALMEGAK
jgi:hypothetical protein